MNLNLDVVARCAACHAELCVQELNIYQSGTEGALYIRLDPCACVGAKEAARLTAASERAQVRIDKLEATIRRQAVQLLMEPSL